MMKIIEDDLTHPATRHLLAVHMQGMQANSPSESVYALDLSGLQKEDVTVWSLWNSETILGCGALHELSLQQAEIKSMRTHPDHLRKGVAAQLLEHMLSVAKLRGYKRLSLETGSGEAFDAALALYRKYGFQDGPAFSNYEASAFNQFLHLDL
ncbi:MAG: GNAT family N-acetyltransferase [Maricaulaceae bacterium]